MIKFLATDLPIWLVFFGLILAIFLSWWTYSGPKARDIFPRGTRLGLQLIRGMVFFLVFLLFIGVLIRDTTKDPTKPVYIIALDQSSSMRFAIDSTQDFRELFQQMSNHLGESFDLNTLEFGARPAPLSDLRFDQPFTDFTSLFDYLRESYQHENVQEVLLITDGIFNRGGDVVSAGQSSPMPVSVWALGDSARYPDARIKEIRYNPMVFKNSKFPVEVILEFADISASTVRLQIRNSSKIVQDTLVQIDQIDGAGVLETFLESGEPGVGLFEFRIETFQGEKNLANNSRRISIEVVDQQANILLVYGAPHPDIGFISEALQNNQRFKFESVLISELSTDLSEYDLIIFYQLPSSNASDLNLINAAITSNKHLLFILGTQSSIDNINRLNVNQVFSSNDRMFEDYSATMAANFNYFEVPDEFSALLDDLPPLIGPLTSVKTSAPTSVLLKQKIKTISLDQPLLWFSTPGSNKYGFLLGEGLWRWGMNEYLITGNKEMTNSLVNGIVSFLSANELENSLTINVPKTILGSQKIVMDAKLFNEALEEVNHVPVSMSIKDSLGNSYDYEFRPYRNSYRLEAGPFMEGRYTYQALTQLTDSDIVAKGAFEVVPVDLEESDLMARYKQLEELTRLSGGTIFGPDQYQDILNYLDKLPITKTNLISNSRWINLLNIKYLLLIIVVLSTLEWIIRRWYGTR